MILIAELRRSTGRMRPCAPIHGAPALFCTAKKPSLPQGNNDLALLDWYTFNHRGTAGRHVAAMRVCLARINKADILTIHVNQNSDTAASCYRVESIQDLMNWNAYRVMGYGIHRLPHF
jgi:hypothetical protein